MKPGLKLYFKPKSGGAPAAAISEDMILKAEYSEDRWRLKNRVIYVGAGGRILADVCEGGGDLPVVVHDPYLTDPHEAERRANVRLSLNKEYGRELRIEMRQRDFEDLGIDLGDTVIVNLPDLGLSNAAMFLLEIGYDPKSLRCGLILGGRLELFEESLREEIGGDVAARFGKLMTLPEQTSTLVFTLDKIARIQADQKHVVYVNKTPLTLYNAQNVILNSSGEVELASGATEGSFEAQVLPPSELFVNWIKLEWMAEKNGGEISADFLNSDGELLGQIYDAYGTQFYRFRKWPNGYGSLTYLNHENWGSIKATVTSIKAGILNAYCIKLAPEV
ncbi:MAG TPA: hypothetical protein ENG52_04870 [Nitrososphaeria archaeon]|nr:hypothetical protein [Nitrososphaeria archaeon]